MVRNEKISHEIETTFQYLLAFIYIYTFIKMQTTTTQNLKGF